MNYVLRLASVYCIYAISASTQQIESPCEISIRVTDAFGVIVPYKVKAFTDSQSVDRRSKFQQLNAKLPCGAYTYQLEREDVKSRYAELRGQIVLRQERQSVWLTTDPNLIISESGAFALAQSGSSKSGTSGRLVNLPTDRSIWISFRQIAGNGRLDSSVGENGEFRLEYYPIGLYAVYVFAEGELLHHLLLRLKTSEAGKPLTIELPSVPR